MATPKKRQNGLLDRLLDTKRKRVSRRLAERVAGWVECESKGSAEMVARVGGGEVVKRGGKWGVLGMKRNPESSAADMYESFHGETSQELVEFQETEHFHENLAALGVLVEIRVSPVTGGRDVNICFDGADGLELENNPVLWPWVGKSWIPYKTFPTEMPAQRLLGKLGDKGLTARVDRVRTRLLPTPRYKWEVLVHRDSMPDMMSKKGTQFSVANPPRHYSDEIRILDSIREGEMILKSKKSVIGRKMSPVELGAVQRAVDNSKAKLAALMTKNDARYGKQNPRKKKGPIGQATQLAGTVTKTVSKPVDEFMGAAGKVGEYLDGLMANPRGKKRNGTVPTFLCSNEKGTQLYFTGGDQTLDLAQLKITGKAADKELITIGDVTHVTYHTRKIFDGKPEEFDYIHNFSEDTKGPQPILLYDRLNKKLSLSGGEYFIDKPWFKTSPGIEN